MLREAWSEHGSGVIVPFTFGGGTGPPGKPLTCGNARLVGGQSSSWRTLETTVRAPFCAPRRGWCASQPMPEMGGKPLAG